MILKFHINNSILKNCRHETDELRSNIFSTTLKNVINQIHSQPSTPPSPKKRLIYFFFALICELSRLFTLIKNENYFSDISSINQNLILVIFYFFNSISIFIGVLFYEYHYFHTEIFTL